MSKAIDAIFIGRAGVDLYGDQTGTRLEDMGSFSKYIGGSPCNTAIGAARLGMKTALISRVGDDAMGRFITEELSRERVNVDHVITDPARMTAMVLLGIRDKEQFPLIFYRENCADMAICTDDITEDHIASARAVVTSGTHFSTNITKAASLRALELAKKHGGERWIDLDYRPVLWGLGSKGDGETRFIADDTVTAHLQSIMPHLDVVVGTEEEFHIVGGSTDTITTLKTLRALTDATFVVKLGAMGCAVFESKIPDDVMQGEVVEGFPIEVFNVLGAGDAFMGGLVTGRLEGKSWHDACRMANACGAFAVSRHACAPSYPSRDELDFFLQNGSDHFRLREDNALEQLHWASTRQGEWPTVMAFAFDHRAQLEALSDDAEKISDFKMLCAEVVSEMAEVQSGLGLLCDRRYGEDALAHTAEAPIWQAAPVEWPSSRPLEFEGGDYLGSLLKIWPRHLVVKCLCFMHPDDDTKMWAAQKTKLRELATACRTWRLELLLELIPPEGTDSQHDTITRAMQMIYEEGIAPDWWKLPAPTDTDWDKTWDGWTELVNQRDPYCRGIVLLGLAAPMDDICATIAHAKSQSLCKGFAVGRSIFGQAAEAWLNGKINDTDAKSMMRQNYEKLIAAWQG
ncbi:MAG: 5-dehydro-2-deoxygluconokinase [Pseudomonadota bacterium]